LLSGRDPSTFPSAISANFFYIIKINKFCGCSSSQIVSTDPGGIRHDHHRQDLHQATQLRWHYRFVAALVCHRQPDSVYAAAAARLAKNLGDSLDLENFGSKVSALARSHMKLDPEKVLIRTRSGQNRISP
jgi:hypothetical protein